MDEGKRQMAAQILLYPEARVPFDTPAAEENNSGLYLECEFFLSFSFFSCLVLLRASSSSSRFFFFSLLPNPHPPLLADTHTHTHIHIGNGIFSFADHYAPRGTPPSHRYISPGMQPITKLKGAPPAYVYTCGFDPLRDVGVEYASKLQEAGVAVTWRHFEELTHGFLQFAPWSRRALEATRCVGEDLGGAVY